MKRLTVPCYIINILTNHLFVHSGKMFRNVTHFPNGPEQTEPTLKPNRSQFKDKRFYSSVSTGLSQRWTLPVSHDASDWLWSVSASQVVFCTVTGGRRSPDTGNGVVSGHYV